MTLLSRLVRAATAWLFALSLLATASCASLSPTPAARAADGPAMWVIRDEDSTIYLFGTVHVMKADTPWRTPRIAAALASADELVLEIREVPRPAVREGWSLVRVKAAGLNRSELRTRQGHSPNVRFPRVLGIECVGIVADSTDPRVPDGTTVAAVMGEMGREFDGGYAQYALLPNSLLMPVTIQLGVDPLHFGVVLVFGMGIGLFAPPLGLEAHLRLVHQHLGLDRVRQPPHRALGRRDRALLHRGGQPLDVQTAADQRRGQVPAAGDAVDRLLDELGVDRIAGAHAGVTRHRDVEQLRRIEEACARLVHGAGAGERRHREGLIC